MSLSPRQRAVRDRLHREGENGINTNALVRPNGALQSYLRRTLNSLTRRGLAVYVCDHLQIFGKDTRWADVGCYEGSFRYVHRDFVDAHTNGWHGPDAEPILPPRRP